MDAVEALHADDCDNDLGWDAEPLRGSHQSIRVIAPEFGTALDSLLGDEYLPILMPRLAFGWPPHGFEHRIQHPRIRQEAAGFVCRHTMALLHAGDERLNLGHTIESRRSGGQRTRRAHQLNYHRDGHQGRADSSEPPQGR